MRPRIAEGVSACNAPRREARMNQHDRLTLDPFQGFYCGEFFDLAIRAYRNGAARRPARGHQRQSVGEQGLSGG